MTTKPLKPLYMWAGGKTRLIKHYRPHLPAYEKFDAYVEPFFGGGALFCDFIANKLPPQRVYINDLNDELIGLLRAVRNKPKRFLAEALKLQAQYAPLSHEARKDYYYRLRQDYWTMQLGDVETAATLYVLMKTSFNGVWQLCAQSGGRFATPAGLLNKASFVDEDSVLAWSKALQGVAMSATGYQEIDISETNALIFCDPPYRGSFTTYGQTFGDKEQQELIDWCDYRAQQGNTVLLANRDVGDAFFEERLPPYCEIHYFDVTYTAGRRKRTEDGFEAKKAREFLAIFDHKNNKKNGEA